MPKKLKHIPGVDPAYLEKQKEMLLRKNRYMLYFNDSEMAAIDEITRRVTRMAEGFVECSFCGASCSGS